MLAFVQEPVRDERNFDAWVYHHYEDHQEIIEGIRAAGGPLLNMYPINTYSDRNGEQWREWHQQMHLDMGNALGIATANLESVDFADEKTSAVWFDLNLRDHEAAHSVLKL